MSVDGRLRWRCRRGLLELDLALLGFLEDGYERLTGPEQARFSELLCAADADLWQWIQGAPAPIRYKKVLCALRNVAHTDHHEETITHD